VLAGSVDRVAAQDDEPITVEKHIPYVEGGTPTQTLDIYRRQGGPSDRVAFVMVHGGGFAGGNPDEMARQARLAAQQGWVAFNLDYRTTMDLGTNGEAWPAELEDVEAGVRWVRAHAAEYGADPDRMVILGASAGGTLAALAAADPDSGLRAAALWSAPLDLATLVPDENGVPPACAGNIQCVEFWRNPWVTNLTGCLPEACPDRYEASSPIAHVSSMPATYLANGTSEIVPVVQPEDYAAALSAEGTKTELDLLPGARHANGYSDSVWNETIPFLADELGVDAPEPIDFDDSPFDPGWATVAVLLAVVGIVVAVVARIATDRRR
jgi:acetyl esterase/lipase